MSHVIRNANSHFIENHSFSVGKNRLRWRWKEGYYPITCDSDYNNDVAICDNIAIAYSFAVKTSGKNKLLFKSWIIQNIVILYRTLWYCFLIL